MANFVVHYWMSCRYWFWTHVFTIHRYGWFLFRQKTSAGDGHCCVRLRRRDVRPGTNYQFSGFRIRLESKSNQIKLFLFRLQSRIKGQKTVSSRKHVAQYIHTYNNKTDDEWYQLIATVASTPVVWLASQKVDPLIGGSGPYPRWRSRFWFNWIYGIGFHISGQRTPDGRRDDSALAGHDLKWESLNKTKKDRKEKKTLGSSAVAERQRNASCISVVSFNIQYLERSYR